MFCFRLANKARLPSLRQSRQRPNAASFYMVQVSANVLQIDCGSLHRRPCVCCDLRYGHWCCHGAGNLVLANSGGSKETPPLVSEANVQQRFTCARDTHGGLHGELARQSESLLPCGHEAFRRPQNSTHQVVVLPTATHAHELCSRGVADCCSHWLDDCISWTGASSQGYVAALGRRNCYAHHASE